MGTHPAEIPGGLTPGNVTFQTAVRVLLKPEALKPYTTRVDVGRINAYTIKADLNTNSFSCLGFDIKTPRVILGNTG